MNELTEVATADEILNLPLELVAFVRVVAMVTVEATEFVLVVGGVRLHWDRPLQVTLRLNLH